MTGSNTERQTWQHAGGRGSRANINVPVDSSGNCSGDGGTEWNAVYWTSESNGCHWAGWSFNNRTRQQAESTAQANCQRGQCSTICHRASAWSGDACFGNAWSRNSSGSYALYLDFGRTAAEAESATLRRCRNDGRTNCELIVSRCP